MTADTIVAIIKLCCALGILVFAALMAREAHGMRKLRLEVEASNKQRSSD
jgi:hypothetical protein